ncbi:hypothetical protein Pan258_53000 [Symmachiella dynata]|nr:hypothetical protein Pan258_53000 [Symmachiella dynata]
MAIVSSRQILLGFRQGEGKAVMADETNASGEAAEPENTEMLWYVLKIQSNREKSIKKSLERRINREGLERYFGEIIIPTEKVSEVKNGKKKVTEHKLFPGYLMVNMILNDDTWFLVRETGGVGDFTGSANKPIPMQEHEIARMLGREEQKEEEAPRVALTFGVGDTVKIKEGPFEGFEGAIDTVDETTGRLTVLVEIFGRTTPVEELEHWQVEAV